MSTENQMVRVVLTVPPAGPAVVQDPTLSLLREAWRRVNSVRASIARARERLRINDAGMVESHLIMADENAKAAMEATEKAARTSRQEQ